MRWIVSIGGTEQTLRSFLTVERGVIDLRKLGAWKAVAGKFYRMEKNLFLSQGSTGRHGAWKPLSTAYAAYKLRRFGAVRIMRLHDRLFNALTTPTAADSVFEEQAQEMAIGTSLLYAKFHMRDSGNRPARRPIDLTNDQEREISDVLKMKIRQLIANARLTDRRGF